MTDTQAGLLPEPSVRNLTDAELANMLGIIATILETAIGIQKSIKMGSAEYVREAAARLLRPSPPASAEVDDEALWRAFWRGYNPNATGFPDYSRAGQDFKAAAIAGVRAAIQASGAAVQVPDGYRKFFHEVAAHCFDDCADLDYLTFTELGVKYGLLVKTMYDPEKHGSNEWGCEPGDEWFEIAAAPQKQGA